MEAPYVNDKYAVGVWIFSRITYSSFFSTFGLRSWDGNDNEIKAYAHASGNNAMYDPKVKPKLADAAGHKIVVAKDRTGASFGWWVEDSRKEDLVNQILGVDFRPPVSEDHVANAIRATVVQLRQPTNVLRVGDATQQRTGPPRLFLGAQHDIDWHLGHLREFKKSGRLPLG